MIKHYDKESGMVVLSVSTVDRLFQEQRVSSKAAESKALIAENSKLRETVKSLTSGKSSEETDKELTPSLKRVKGKSPRNSGEPKKGKKDDDPSPPAAPIVV